MHGVARTRGQASDPARKRCHNPDVAGLVFKVGHVEARLRNGTSERLLIERRNGPCLVSGLPICVYAVTQRGNLRLHRADPIGRVVPVKSVRPLKNEREPTLCSVQVCLGNRHRTFRAVSCQFNRRNLCAD